MFQSLAFEYRRKTSKDGAPTQPYSLACAASGKMPSARGLSSADQSAEQSQVSAPK